MKHKKLILVTFSLALFIFQQSQANAKTLPKDSLSQNNLTQQNGLLPDLDVRMYHLNGDGSVVFDRRECLTAVNDNAYGCVENPTSQVYPYDFNPMQLAYDADPNNHLQIDMEADYLLDVLSHEMDVPTYPNFVPLQAQAVAARSFADYNYRAQGIINNSTEDHVFVPYAFESYLQNVGQQNVVRDAVNSTSKYYLAQGGSAINAEFASDSVGFTVPSTNPNEPYLIRVEDPISAACDSTNNGQDSTGKVRGMSQRGANRWAFGNQCSTGGGAAWPVTWTDYRQILAHYYTGIDILNSSGNPVAPGDRWNLLEHDVPVSNGATYTVNVEFQNTSTSNWTANNIIIGYQWTAKGDPFVAGEWIDNVSLPSVNTGTSIEGPLTIPIELGGDVTLHLDLRHANDEESWFSEQDLPWPDATIDIDDVAGPTATLTFTPTFTPIPVTSTPTLITGVLTCNTVVAGVTCTNYGSYLDYNINIIRTGLTGGATAGGITIGTYKRSTNGGNMGMKSDFVHSETSGYAQNTVYSRVVIQPFDAAAVGYAGFSSGGAGTNVSVTNKVLDWRYIGGSGGWPNTLSVGGDVNWPITGYSIVGHIYLYSNQNFITVTPTSMPTAQPTVTPKPCNCTVDLLSLGDPYCSIFGSSSKLAVPIPIKLLQSTQQAILDVQLFHRVEDEILSQTPQGQHYINLYYGHGTEIVGLLRGNSDLKAEAIATLQLWEPSLQALVDGQGSNVIITSGQVQTVQTFLDHLYALGSPELRQTIESERTLNPLEQNIGRTIDQASVSLVDYQVPSSITPTTTSTPSPTETSTPTVTIPDTPTNTPTEAPTDAATATFSPLPTETPTSSETPTFTPTYTSTPTVTPAPITLAFYLHGNGATANPPTLFLDSTAPTGTTTKYKDSASVNFNGGNSWKEVGDWIAAPIQTSGQLTALNNLQVWLGLKNSDDQGTNFDLRVEVYENNTLLGSAESLCITGITRNANLAKQVILPFDTLPPADFNGTTDVLSLKIKTRIGTNGAGGMCGGHSNAIGLRLYFDASHRPAGFDGVFGP